MSPFTIFFLHFSSRKKINPKVQFRVKLRVKFRVKTYRFILREWRQFIAEKRFKIHLEFAQKNTITILRKRFQENEYSNIRCLDFTFAVCWYLCSLTSRPCFLVCGLVLFVLIQLSSTRKY